VQRLPFYELLLHELQGSKYAGRATPTGHRPYTSQTRFQREFHFKIQTRKLKTRLLATASELLRSSKKFFHPEKLTIETVSLGLAWRDPSRFTIVAFDAKLPLANTGDSAKNG